MLTEEQPKKIRVTLTDGSQMEIEHPRVSGDTLIGCEVRGRRRCPSDPSAVQTFQQVNIPLSDVTDVAISKTDAIKTGGLIVGTVLVVGAAVLAVGYLIVCKSGTTDAC